MKYIHERITVDPLQCGGRPCIRGLRIRVSDIIDLLSAGMTFEEIIEENPDLETEDLKSALHYVSKIINHPIVAA